MKCHDVDVNVKKCHGARILSTKFKSKWGNFSEPCLRTAAPGMRAFFSPFWDAFHFYQTAPRPSPPAKQPWSRPRGPWWSWTRPTRPPWRPPAPCSWPASTSFEPRQQSQAQPDSPGASPPSQSCPSSPPPHSPPALTACLSLAGKVFSSQSNESVISLSTSCCLLDHERMHVVHGSLHYWSYKVEAWPRWWAPHAHTPLYRTKVLLGFLRISVQFCLSFHLTQFL